MATPEKLRTQDLVVGGRYLHVNGLFIRQIDSIEGDTVIYHDQYGHGRCGKRVFLKQCPSMPSKEQEALAEQELLNHVRLTSEDDFTLRDEANALTAYAFRNGFLEDLHAGKSSPLVEQPEYSRISDDEMRKLMIQASGKMEEMLRLKSEQPANPSCSSGIIKEGIAGNGSVIEAPIVPGQQEMCSSQAVRAAVSRVLVLFSRS